MRLFLLILLANVSLADAPAMPSPKQEPPTRSSTWKWYEDENQRSSFQLKAINPWSEPGVNPPALDPAAQSFLGFELQLPFEPQAPVTSP